MAIRNWIFVSHSSHDLEKVRQVRDFLESRGHSPVLFFLLSLTNSSLLPKLIEEEIRLRHFFVLCNSKAARDSVWVQQEIRIVKAASSEKVYEEIDLDADLAPQLDKLLALSKRSTVFLSFAPEDREVAARMRSAFEADDFKVLTDDDVRAGESVARQIDDLIGVAAQTGYALVLASNDYLARPSRVAELTKANEKAELYRRSNVVPVIIERGLQMPANISSLNAFDLTTGDFDERVRLLIRELKQWDME
jgi:hypothetical protein